MLGRILLSIIFATSVAVPAYSACCDDGAGYYGPHINYTGLDRRCLKVDNVADCKELVIKLRSSATALLESYNQGKKTWRRGKEYAALVRQFKTNYPAVWQARYIIICGMDGICP